MALVKGGWARGWGLFRRRRNGARVCEVRARRFRLSVSASSRAPRLVLLLSSALFAFVPFPPPLPLPLRPPPREGLGVAAFNYAHISGSAEIWGASEGVFAEIPAQAVVFALPASS